MPFLEHIADMSRFTQKRATSAPEAAKAPEVRLSACNSASDAQTALLALLWSDREARRPSAVYLRLLRYANRLTRNVEDSMDIIMDCYCYCLEHWQTIDNAQAYMFKRIRGLAALRVRKHGCETAVGDASDVAEIEEMQANNRVAGMDGRYSAARATLVWLLDHIAVDREERQVIRYALAWSDDETVGYGRIALYPDLDAIGRELGVSGGHVGRVCKRIGVRAGMWHNERLAAKWQAQAGPRRSGHWLAGGNRHLWSVLAWFCSDRALERQMIEQEAKVWATELVCELIYRACIEPRLLTAGN